MRRWLWLAALTPLLSPAAGESKNAPPLTPIVGPSTPLTNMMLDVQRVQVRMGQGEKGAYAEERKRLLAVGAAIAAAGPDAFKVKAERDAVVGYVLSGGRPRDAMNILDRGDFPGGETDLLRGAIGYALGRQGDAEALLTFEPKTQSLRLGSQLAYAQSVLLTPKDARKSLDLLDLARLLAPGSLIEEAALRREILLVGDLHDPDRVAFLARQYVERYGKSIYAGNFVQGLAGTAVRYDLCSDLPNLDKFSALLELVTAEQHRAFLLAVSRASVLGGRLDVASQAALRVLKTADPSPADAARAHLYDTISRFPRLDDEAAKAAFAAVDRSLLSPADRDLLAASLALRDRMYEAPPRAAYQDIWREASVATARSPETQVASDPASATIRRAVAALTSAEALGAKENAP